MPKERSCYNHKRLQQLCQLHVGDQQLRVQCLSFKWFDPHPWQRHRQHPLRGQLTQPDLYRSVLRHVTATVGS